MRLTVFGASGQTGASLITQALERGDLVTAVVRDPARLPTRHPSLRVVAVGDLDDLDATRRALDDADAVLSGIGPRSRKDAPVAAPATRAILKAIGDAAPQRLVVISAAPVGPSPDGDSLLNRRLLMPAIGAILRPVYDDLRAMEADLAASPTAWTAFRPPKLTNDAPTGRYRTAIDANVPRGYSLSRVDLAAAMLACLTEPETERHAVGIAN
jgi:putative NADH-flavin reductase